MIIEIQDIENLPFIITYEKRKINTKGKICTRLINICIPDKPGVYLLYGEDKELLYIGQTKSLMQRISTHRFWRKKCNLK